MAHINGETTKPFPNRYWETSEYSRLVTPMQNMRLPVYRWYSFKHSFSRNLVRDIINQSNLSKESIILDPFCGAGTTMLACKEMGIDSIGLDLMPLSVFISNTKVNNFDRKDIEFYLSHITSSEVNTKIPEHIEKKLSKYFPRNNLIEATFLKEYIQKIESPSTSAIFQLVLLSIMEEISLSRKDGAFIRLIKDKKPKDTMNLFKERMSLFLADIDFLNSLPKTNSFAYIGDARETKLRKNSISAVITSPPYPNRHDYTRIYYLELMFWFYNSQEELKKLRYESLRSHVEAREKYEAKNYKEPEELTSIIDELKKRELPNRSVINLVENYFKDIYIFLIEMKRVLIKGGTITLVIGDSRYGGISVPAGKLIIKIAEDIGFDLIKDILARDKGNSPQQMGKYGKTISNESVITLLKR